jgi:hypothetical protein
VESARAQSREDNENDEVRSGENRRRLSSSRWRLGYKGGIRQAVLVPVGNPTTTLLKSLRACKAVKGCLELGGEERSRQPLVALRRRLVLCKGASQPDERLTVISQLQMATLTRQCLHQSFERVEGEKVKEGRSGYDRCWRG